MFPKPFKVNTVYEAFVEMLPFALQTAEVKHNFPGLSSAAHWRILKHQVESNQGNTGYLNAEGINPAQCVKDYIAYIYGETNAKPDFLIAAEGR